MKTELDKGWGACKNTPKWHYFIGGRSLCRRFMKLSNYCLEQGNDNSPDNCKECQKKLFKLKALEGGEE